MFRVDPVYFVVQYNERSRNNPDAMELLNKEPFKLIEEAYDAMCELEKLGWRNLAIISDAEGILTIEEYGEEEPEEGE